MIVIHLLHSLKGEKLHSNPLDGRTEIKDVSLWAQRRVENCPEMKTNHERKKKNGGGSVHCITCGLLCTYFPLGVLCILFGNVFFDGHQAY